MTSVPTRSDRSRPHGRIAAICLGIALLSPLTVLLAAAGVKTGLLSIDVGFDLVTMKIGLGLAGLGGVAALVAVIAALAAPRRAGLAALAAVLIAAVTIVAFWSAVTTSAANASGSGDVSTDAVDSPRFSSTVLEERAAAGADPAPERAGDEVCAVAALRTQSAPGAAAYALKSAGFAVRGFGVGRADGTHASFWFNVTHDAVIRIRPGRTDIRVTSRDHAHDRGAACRLARAIAAGLQASE